MRKNKYYLIYSNVSTFFNYFCIKKKYNKGRSKILKYNF